MLGTVIKCISAISVDECSGRFVGSLINCFMLYSCIRSLILLLLTLSMFMLKSPRTMLSRICHVDTFIPFHFFGVKIICVTVRGVCKTLRRGLFWTLFDSQLTQPPYQEFPGQFGAYLVMCREHKQ